MHEYVDAYIHVLLMFKCMPFKDLIFKLLLTLWIIKPAKALQFWDKKVIPRGLVSVGMDESHVCVLLKSFTGNFDTSPPPQGWEPLFYVIDNFSTSSFIYECEH